jgi:hypothetical protein
LWNAQELTEALAIVDTCNEINLFHNFQTKFDQIPGSDEFHMNFRRSTLEFDSKRNPWKNNKLHYSPWAKTGRPKT